MNDTAMELKITRDLKRFDSYLSSRVRPGTKQLYLQSIKRWTDFASNASNTNKNVNNSSNNDILNEKTAQLYINSLAKSGKAPNTIATHGHAIMRYLKWKGVNIKLDIPTITMKQPEYLTIEQVENVLANCNTPLEKAIVTVLFDTAVRINELLTIELKDINFASGIITVTRKGGRVEEVNISTKAMDSIKRWLAARRYSSSTVFNVDYHIVWKLVKKVGKRAGIDLHPHMLRHSRARHMLTMGTPPHIVQQHLGHRNIATTLNIYGKFMASQIKKDIPEW